MTKITAVTVLFVLSASTALAQQQMVAFDHDHPLRFDHRCAELGHGYGAYRVVICGQTLVGYTPGPSASNPLTVVICGQTLVGYT